MGDTRKAYDILVGKPQGRRSFGRPRRGWDDNIRTDLRETVWVSVEWIHLDQDGYQWRALRDTVMDLRFP
jgi:hypothetical protein